MEEEAHILHLRKRKVEFYELSEWLMEKFFREGYNSREVSRKLKEEKNIEISHMTLEAFKKDALKNSREFIAGGKEEYKKRLAELYLDSVENLVEMMAEIKMKIEQMRDHVTPVFDKEGNQIGETEDWQAHAKYIELALKELHLILKRNKEIGPDIQTIKNTYNIANTSEAIKDRVISLIEHLLNQGITLDKFPPEWQELYRKLKGTYA